MKPPKHQRYEMHLAKTGQKKMASFSTVENVGVVRRAFRLYTWTFLTSLWRGTKHIDFVVNERCSAMSKMYGSVPWLGVFRRIKDLKGS